MQNDVSEVMNKCLNRSTPFLLLFLNCVCLCVCVCIFAVLQVCFFQKQTPQRLLSYLPFGSMVGVVWGGLTTEPEDMGQQPQGSQCQ